MTAYTTPIRKTAIAAALLVGAIAQTVNAAPWIMRHGYDSAAYQDYYDNHLPAGYRPVSVNVHGTGANARFAAVWINDGLNNWAARHDMSSADYQNEATILDGLGHRIISVDGAGEYPNEEYVAAFVNDGVPDTDWGALHRRTSAQMATDMDNYAMAGFRPVSFSGYGSGANARFAAAWVKNYEGWSYDWDWGLTEAEYQTAVEDRARDGYRVLCITAYGTALNPTMGAIWVRPDGNNWVRQPAWFAKHNIDGTEFQDTADEHWGITLFRPSTAVQYGSLATPEFATAYFEDTPPPVFSATGIAQPTLPHFDGVMENFMTTRQFQRGALAITKDNRLVYNRAFTYDYPAQWDTQPSHRFRVASVSKPFTAVAAQIAENKGLFSLGDTLADIPGFDSTGWLAGDDVPNNVTIDMLLKHQGGWDRNLDPMLNDVNISNALGVSLPLDLDDIIEDTKTQALKFAPGTDYEYSNFGYALVGRVIELTSGQSYEDFVRENVLCPIGAEGMVQGFTDVLQPGEVNYTDPMYRLFPSVMDDTRPYVLYPYGRYNIDNMDAHGGWVATAEELAKFVSDFTDETTSSLLSQSEVDYMFNENSQTNSYGAGWQRSGTTRFHNGSLRGTWAYIIRRDDGVTISVLFNGRSNGHNTPIADNDGDIYTMLMDAADLVGATPSLSWPAGDLFTPGTCQPTCPDFNGDRVVDGADLAQMLSEWGQRLASTDLNGDGVVDGADLAELLSYWGVCGESTQG